MKLEVGQIWIRRKSEEFKETWRVRVEIVSDNSIAFRVVEFEGEQPPGTLLSMKKEKFFKLYYPDKRKNPR